MKSEKEELLTYMLGIAEEVLPEWKPDPDNYDAGLTLLSVFCDYMLEGRAMSGQLMKKYKYAFFQRLGTRRTPVQPAAGAVKLCMTGSDVKAAALPAGFICSGKTRDGVPCRIRLCDAVTAGTARLKHLFQVLDEGTHIEQIPVDEEQIQPFRPGVKNRENEQTGVWYFRHDELFDLHPGAYLSVYGIPEKEQSRWEFSCFTEQGWEVLAVSRHDSDGIRLELEEKRSCPAVVRGQHGFWLRCCRSYDRFCCPEAISFQAGAPFRPAGYLQGELETFIPGTSFFPFGKRLMAQHSFYIGQDEVLSSKGARIELYLEGDIRIVPDEMYVAEEIDYKWIMKREDLEQKEPHDVMITRIAWEYYNGQGWQVLSDFKECGTYQKGEHFWKKFCFSCPEDIVRFPAGAEETYMIRARIMEPERVSRSGVRYVLPELKDVSLSYQYEEKETAWQQLVYTNRQWKEHADSGGRLFADARLEGADGCYVCLDRIQPGEYLHLYIETQGGWQTMKPEYLNDQEWEELDSEEIRQPSPDHSGTDTFLRVRLPESAAEYELFGVQGFWMRCGLPDYRVESVVSCICLHTVRAEEVVSDPMSLEERPCIDEYCRLRPERAAGFFKEAVPLGPFQGGRAAWSEDEAVVFMASRLWHGYPLTAGQEEQQQMQAELIRVPELQGSGNSFAAISSRGKERLAEYMPEWTDYNYHDPGITLLELFAWMQEIWWYRADQITAEHEQKFLGLLGVTPEPARAAHAGVRFQTEEPVHLPRGFRVSAGDINYGLEEEVYVQAGALFPAAQVKPFGERGRERRLFYLGFTTRLQPLVPVSIYVQIEALSEVPRVPIEKGYDPGLARLILEYYGSDGWQQAEILQDDTYGFLQSGSIHIQIPGAMAWTTYQERSCGLIRFRLAVCNYDRLPVITKLWLNHGEAVQMIGESWQNGNVRAGSINQAGQQISGLRVWNEQEASGGKPAETIEESYDRFRQKWEQVSRAASDEEYMELTMRTPGLCIAACSSYQERQRQVVVIRPDTGEPYPQAGRAYRQAVRRWLDRYRMAGTMIRVRSPVYIGISVVSELYTEAEPEMVKKQAAQAVREIMEPLALCFGCLLNEAVISQSIMERCFPARVRYLTIRTDSGLVNVRDDKAIQLPPYGLPDLKEVEIICRIS